MLSTETLNKEWTYDSGKDQCTRNADFSSGAKANVLNIIEAEGNAHGAYSGTDFKEFLRQHDIEIAFKGNRIIAKAIYLRRLNLGDFDNNVSFTSVDQYLEPVQEVQQGHISLMDCVKSQITTLTLSDRVSLLERGAIKTTDELNASISKLRYQAALLPVGTIVAWSGQGGKEALPDGWEICDGHPGVPDLKDQFLRGVTDFSDKVVNQHGGRPLTGAGLLSRDEIGGNKHSGVNVSDGEPVNVPLNYSVIYIIRVK